ncbi:MAG: 6-phosphogluconolactonase [Spirochaetia bacterium]|jgi:6-phosphogluconolactonase|nr:6-phosphogluconolactonase [Spirochaetia bacterium]
MSLSVRRFQDEQSWIEAILGDFKACLADALVKSQKRFDATLAGGTTPGAVYRALAEDLDCARLSGDLDIHLWVGDEREVPAYSPGRNGGLIAELLDTGSRWTRRPTLHYWPEGERRAACRGYEKELIGHLGLKPVFDLSVLGMGTDGHTAGLFTAADVFEAEGALAIATLAPSEPVLRMSLSARVLKSSRRTMVLLKGREKESILRSLETAAAWYPVLEALSADSRLYYLGD